MDEYIYRSALFLCVVVFLIVGPVGTLYGASHE